MITIHPDRSASPRDYAPGLLTVTSFFRTIQGEGLNAGRPAVFLRLSGCNYGEKTDFCQFCDTDFRRSRGLSSSVSEVVDALVALPGYSPADLLVITGGEPTLQPALHELISTLWAASLFREINIETNGTQPRFFADREAMDATQHTKITVSPKANERLKKYPRVHPDVIRGAAAFKFVVSADPESAHHTVPEWALHETRPVFVSPMTVYLRPYDGEVSSVWDATLVDQQKTAANYAYAAAYALTHGLRLTVQLHTLTAIP